MGSTRDHDESEWWISPMHRALHGLSRHTGTIAVAFIVAAVTAGAPVIAAKFDAKNAKKVGGIKAVKYTEDPGARAKRLVAADAEGFLPPNVVEGLQPLLNAPPEVPLDNVLIVAKTGGDFSTITAAMNSITDSSSGNPYLIWVGPGVYEERVDIKQFVQVEGAGIGATTIRAAGGSNVTAAFTVRMTVGSELRDLSVVNTGGAQGATGVSSEGGSIHRVEIDVSGSAPTYLGVYVVDDETRIRNSSIEVTGPGTNWGVNMFSGALDIRDAHVLAEDGFDNRGFNVQPSTRLHARDVSIEVHGITTANNTSTGVFSAGVTRLHDVDIDATGLSETYFGVRSTTDATSATPDLVVRGGSIVASGPDEATGISLENGPDALITDVHIRADEGLLGSNGLSVIDLQGVTIDASSRGIRTDNGTAGATIEVDGSKIAGTTNSVFANTGWVVRIGASQLAGPVTETGGTATCVASYDVNYAAIASC